jgi:multidrug transporter EmrE-like cation transporter
VAVAEHGSVTVGVVEEGAASVARPLLGETISLPRVASMLLIVAGVVGLGLLSDH